jgi:hypothetical protein
MARSDRVRDAIDCGPGNDEVRYYTAIDPRDVLTNCEGVSVGSQPAQQP